MSLVMDDSTISRIVVETEPDWLRIQDNVAKSIAASMETRLALLPGGKDGAESQALRKELEQRLAKIQEEIWRASRPNLRVNGHDYEHYEPTTEPFDEALDRDIWSLDTERVESEIELGNLRKDRPAFLYKKESDLENRKLHAEWFPEDDEEASQGKAQKKSEPIPEPPRHAEVVQTFNKVLQNISELSSTLPDQLSRANRAQNVRTEIANLPL